MEEDYQTLFSTMLVSRSWHECTVPYLFQEVTVAVGEPEPTPHAITTAYVPSATRQNKLEMFLEYINHSYIGSCIRTLVLRTSLPPSKDASIIHPFVDAKTLKDVLRRLTQLHDLLLEDIVVTPDHDGADFPPGFQPRNLSSLRVSYAHIDKPLSLNELLGPLSLLGSVDDVTLKGFTSLEGCVLSGNQIRQTLNVKSLCIVGKNVPSPLRALTANNCLNSLKRMEI